MGKVDFKRHSRGGAVLKRSTAVLLSCFIGAGQIIDPSWSMRNSEKGVSAAEYIAEFYVSPDGDDSADGSESSPFKTLERARDAVRSINTCQNQYTTGISHLIADGRS